MKQAALKITGKVRNEAILICLCIADLKVPLPTGLWHVVGRVEPKLKAEKLAYAANWRIVTAGKLASSSTQDRLMTIKLEAAALLADGWCPGDPIVLLQNELP